MKKSIVLLISLFFISALSILIFKNLEDTNFFIKEKNDKLKKIQLITSIKNTQVEISKLFLENTKNIDNIVTKLDSQFIPINIKDISVLFMLKEYDRVNINLLSQSDSKKYKEVNELFLDNSISDFDSFKYMFKTLEKEYKITSSENKNFVNNNKQIDDIIIKFMKETYSNKVLNIKNKLGFIDKNENENLYELFIKVNYLDDFAKAYYILNKKGVVKYFESSFK